MLKHPHHCRPTCGLAPTRTFAVISRPSARRFTMVDEKTLVDRILSLPPELRAMIYERSGGPSSKGWIPIRRPPFERAMFRTVMRLPKIMRVNRSLRRDVLALKHPYEKIRIDFMSISDSLRTPDVADEITAWLASSSKELIRGIKEFELS